MMRTYRPSKHSSFMTYLLTFACYGWHLPGDAGIVDRNHNIPGAPVPEPNAALLLSARRLMRQSPYTLGSEERRIVRNAIRDVCRYKGWGLLATHIRTNHVHVVVQADSRPEAVLNVLKSYSSRALNLGSPDKRGRIRWVRHGSTRYLPTAEAIDAAVKYVLSSQGETMAAYQAPQRSAS
jgi:REP element-mobilizing transposase RayT